MSDTDDDCDPIPFNHPQPVQLEFLKRCEQLGYMWARGEVITIEHIGEDGTKYAGHTEYSPYGRAVAKGHDPKWSLLEVGASREGAVMVGFLCDTQVVKTYREKLRDPLVLDWMKLHIKAM